MSFLSRIFRRSEKAAEGAYRPGPYLLADGWLSATAGRYMNWWQMGYSPRSLGEGGAMVEACVSRYSQTVAMCPGDHWWKLDNGGRERVTTSALSRILREPNDYQSISDFLLNLTRRLYLDGESIAVAIRNERSEIASLHLMRGGTPLVAEDGSIFYQVYGNEILERRFDLTWPIPARDILHVRLHTRPGYPLRGLSPILAAALDLEMSGAVLNQQIAFYLNQARPSFMLETDEHLTKEQVSELRELWDRQTRGENAGGTPILSWGLKAKEVSKSAKDGEIADLLKMTDQNVALAFGVPLQVLGLGGTTFASTELLMQSWIASGLGFALNHIEEAIGRLFKLKGFPDEYLELDTKALLRSAYKDRIEGLAKGVISGIYAPDEARGEEDLPRVPGGHGAEPRVQQQVVPLSYGSEMKPPTPALPAPDDDEPQEDDDGESRGFDHFSRQIDGLTARYAERVH